jgi:type I restriction enzyme M protein
MVAGAQRARFIEALRELGGSAGNGKLREALGWPEDTYRAVQAALIEDGAV